MNLLNNNVIKNRKSLPIKVMQFGGGNTLTFDAVGENAILMYVNSKWQLLAGTAAVS